MADRQIRTIVRGLERVTENVVRKLTLDVVANLVESTPVDTGWARNNWVPAIGAPIEKDLSDVVPTEQAARSAKNTQSAGLASVASGYRLKRGAVFISNNVPYIQRLNDGSSAKEPAGFVQRAISKAVTLDIRGFKG